MNEIIVYRRGIASNKICLLEKCLFFLKYQKGRFFLEEGSLNNNYGNSLSPCYAVRTKPHPSIPLPPPITAPHPFNLVFPSQNPK
jgi:hypothetical protein